MLRHALYSLPRLLAVVALVGVATFTATPASAQKIKPGLWENSISMKGAGGQADAAMARMQEQMARLPPEQRAQVEAMMARQGVGMAAGKPNTVRSCISPEMARRDEFNPGDSRCKVLNHSRSGNVVRFKVSCQIDGATSDGDGEFTLVSDAETRGRMMMNVVRQGQAMSLQMDTTSRWLGADCGDLKPVGSAAK